MPHALTCALLALLTSSAVARSLEEDLRPDKRDDAWTTSSRFKRDLLELFPPERGAREVVLELGAHLGHCTRVLSRLFNMVLAVEHSEAVLASNVQRTRDLSNIVHLRFHTVLDDWSLLRQSRIDVVFIDAAHDYRSVKSDLEQALELPHVRLIVLDDYGAEKGVRQAVDEALTSGRVALERHVGEAPPWEFAGRVVQYWEGVVLRPLGGATAERSLTELLSGSTWVVFPAGVFVSGYFQPHGLIHFAPEGLAETSYGPAAWRALTAAELQDGTADVAALQLEGGWRAELQFNGRRTAAVLFRSDGVELVMLPQEMMRTVGEKLLSFMH